MPRVTRQRQGADPNCAFGRTGSPTLTSNAWSCQARPGHSHFRAEILLSSREGRTRAVRARSLLPGNHPNPTSPRGPVLQQRLCKTGALEEEARGATEAGCSQRGPVGAGAGDHSSAGATGRAPPLPVSSTNGPAAAVPAPRGSCNSQKQKPKGGTSPAALEDCWAPTPFTGLPGLTARGREAQWVTIPGDAGCSSQPCPIRWEARPPGREQRPAGWGGGRRAASGSSCPRAPGPGQLDGGGKSLGLADLVLTQLLGEDLLKGHLAPVFQVLLHDASDAERQRGWGGALSEPEPPGLLPGLLALPLPPGIQNVTVPSKKANYQPGPAHLGSVPKS